MGIKTAETGDRYVTVGGDSYYDRRYSNSGPWVNLKILTLIWRLVKIFFRYGNQDVFFHICGSGGAWDVPMEAENVEVRLTNTGPKVTIW